jgi:hypothetical protein
MYGDEKHSSLLCGHTNNRRKKSFIGQARKKENILNPFRKRTFSDKTSTVYVCCKNAE